MGNHTLKLDMPSPEVIANMSRAQIINLRRDLLEVHHNLCNNKKNKCKCVLKNKPLPPIP